MNNEVLLSIFLKHLCIILIQNKCVNRIHRKVSWFELEKNCFLLTKIQYERSYQAWRYSIKYLINRKKEASWSLFLGVYVSFWFVSLGLFSPCVFLIMTSLFMLELFFPRTSYKAVFVDRYCLNLLLSWSVFIFIYCDWKFCLVY